jgi:hypothetical protein
LAIFCNFSADRAFVWYGWELLYSLYWGLHKLCAL